MKRQALSQFPNAMHEPREIRKDKFAFRRRFERFLNSPAATMSLPTDSAHVWFAWLDAPALTDLKLARYISAVELERSNGFYQQIDRSRFIARRAILRILLARYLALQPKEVRLVEKPGCRPELAWESNTPRLRFSMSTSKDAGLWAFAFDRALGVDLERIRSDFDCDEVATQFAFEEQTMLASQFGTVRRGAFFDCWTRKEAYLKARGFGLSLSLADFAVNCAPDEAPVLFRTESGAPPPAYWHMIALSPANQLSAALVIERPIKQIQCWIADSESLAHFTSAWPISDQS